MQPTTSGPSRASPSPFSSVITGHCLCGALTVTVAAPHMASRLVVTIEAMQVLPITEAAGVFAWLRALDYPWSSAECALQSIPKSELLSPIARLLRRHVAVV